MEIPNGEILYRYADPSAFPTGQKEVPAAVFMDRDLSCDWSHYMEDPSSSPHIAQGRSVIVFITVCDEIKNPGNKQGPVLAWKQDVIHDPLGPDDEFGPNDAHSLVRGLKKAAVVSALVKNSYAKFP